MGSRGFVNRLFPAETPHWLGYHEELHKHLPARGAVLDLGCGDNTELARYRTREREVWGADFDTHPRLAHPEWFRPLDREGAIPFPADTFDLVAATWVLEHVGDPARFLSEVCRVLRPGGYFVAHTISGHHYVTWLRRLLDLLPHSVVQKLVLLLYGRQPHDTFPTHYRLNTPSRLRTAADAAGLAAAGIRHYADQGYFNFSAVLYNAAALADWLLETLRPGLGRIYLTAVMRKPPAVAKAASRGAA